MDLHLFSGLCPHSCISSIPWETDKICVFLALGLQGDLLQFQVLPAASTTLVCCRVLSAAWGRSSTIKVNYSSDLLIEFAIVKGVGGGILASALSLHQCLERRDL